MDNKTHRQERLAAPFGVLIDREKPLSFSFEGQTFDAFEGDTVASALVANQQWLLSRSFKYHRPRGPLTMAGQDANTLVQLKSQPNTLADKCQVSLDLQVSGQNYFGSLNRDWRAYLGLFSRFLPVGFYYKAFYRPKGIWELWAKFFRRQAGLGEIDQTFQPATDPHNYLDKQYKFADVVVVGGGPAGMSAALAAAEQGAEVLLIDENPILGGSLNYLRPDQDHVDPQELHNEIAANPSIEVMTNAVCNSWHADNWLAVVTAKRLYKVRAQQLVLASGSLEQQAIFRGNDLPGVVLSSAVQRLIRLYAVKPADTAVVLTGNDEGYATALDLLDSGTKVAAIIDMRESPADSQWRRLAQEKGLLIESNSAVFEAHYNRRSKRIRSVEVRPIVAQGECGQEYKVFDCDLLVMAVGYMPTYQLACQAGAQLSYDDALCQFQLANLPINFHLAGSVDNSWHLAHVVSSAKQIGAKAACQTIGKEAPADIVHTHSDDDPTMIGLNHPWPMFEHPKGKEFVDYDEDLQIKDIVNATRDGYEHIQLVKRYSTCGMGPSQGRHSALAAARIVAHATAKTVAETGVTTARPPFASEPLGVNAGRSFYPERRTNMHDRHVEAGAEMMQAGAWYRPAYYGKSSQRDSVIAAEVSNVRSNVGLIDVSTLGGIEIRGTDAAEFLNRFYTFSFTKQPVGRARYALLCNEAGVVIDDGVACRIHYDHFYVTATTGGVDRVYQSMLKWNLQWGLNVDIANATTAWCGVNIAGPNARKVLAKVCSDIELSSEAFPYMGVREGSINGIPARLIRVGFVGELGYEIHVPQQYGEALWDSLMLAGADHGIKPFGVEAQRVLRLEKGHVIIGQDTDAMSNPMELQMNWALSKKKPFHLGSRTIRELQNRPLQRVLVGFFIDYKRAPLPKESELVLDGEQMIGRVTSVCRSPSLNKIIGLAYVPVEKSTPGTVITIKTEGGRKVKAEVAEHALYDPQNLRQEL